MYTNSAYLNHSKLHFKDKSRPLIVASCGTYRLFTRSKLPTYRPRGRIDYQLLYIAAGKAHFFFEEDVEEIVTAGHMVLYRPREMQKYVYYWDDQTEVFWVHFTGNDVKQILRRYKLPSTGHVFYTGTSPDYQQLFRKMIQSEDESKVNSYAQNQAEMAACYFNTHYNTDINIEQYAASRNMSTCWFIRNFKRYNGITPMKYILSIRISNAQHLLETTSYHVNEIADIIGYDDPLYFSRLFRKQVGFSPSEYRRKKKMESQNE